VAAVRKSFLEQVLNVFVINTVENLLTFTPAGDKA